jgi:hypothetical protein
MGRTGIVLRFSLFFFEKQNDFDPAAPTSGIAASRNRQGYLDRFQANTANFIT